MRFALLTCWLGLGAVTLLGLVLEPALRTLYTALALLLWALMLPFARRVKRTAGRGGALHESQSQLMQAEKTQSLGYVVAGIAHELNNPLGFVHANLQLVGEYLQKLGGGSGDDEEARNARASIQKLLARSREGTERMKKIVQDLRAFVHEDQAELQEADLHEELDRTLELMEPHFMSRIHIERDYGELPAVRCLAGQLNQVFMNLLMNACDAIEGEGEIRITTRATPTGIQLAFHDDGPGIPEEVRERVFEPFFTTKPDGEGTGLGLSLSHGIIRRHGGALRVEAEPGRGACFVIDLPAVDARQPESLGL